MESKLIDYIVTHKEKHYRIAYSYVKNKEDALDIVQDTIVKALKYKHTLHEPSYLNTWFIKILINNCKTYLQKQNRYIDVEDEILENLDSPHMDTYRSFELEEALDKLSYTEKTIILLRYFEQLELKEVAKVMDKNLSTVKSTLYRALKKLKVQLEED